MIGGFTKNLINSDDKRKNYMFPASAWETSRDLDDVRYYIFYVKFLKFIL